ncbi:conserved hypothetical protein; putative membrane protein [Hyphomicrobium sp. GJ21]|uniref:DUF4159 domain-containing protein n=1 Tax=Hyphomicrobium sp. GJ21 TaxID=113574 RepID=UPI000622C215|nr:DUF4159 domain-containing protein [Hyphomicrobium sp. GJ21]CEJ88716.1 conserved hypothetical protein; putative membrane protein [Hyphomicrobium sp. GJ21]
MSFGPLAFLNPWLLAALITLPIIYWLLRAVPPRPTQVQFPPTRILVGLDNDEKTAEKTPWWLTLIRLIAATLVILALAEPILNPSRDAALSGEGPVVLFVDNGWSAASRWPERVAMIDRIIGEAESKGRPVIVAGTAAATRLPVLKIQSPAEARSTAAALVPEPFAPDRGAAAEALRKALAEASVKNPSIVWLQDGIDHKSDVAGVVKTLTELAGNGTIAVLDEAQGREALGLAAHLGEKGKLEATVLSPGGPARTGSVYAYSARSERLGEAPFKLAAGERSTTVVFELPLELRNQVARLEIASERSAGSVSLIDAATQWHRVGLLSGESREEAQPLLAPLYYIEKALKPYADIAIAKNANLSDGLDSVFKQNISVLMLADIGTLTGEAAKKVDDFVKRGGLLVRFAGPRLEKAGDDLLPVVLRSGGRSLGGALSWSTPQPLAGFDENSPFAGLTIPKDVTINRQVLADPAELTPEIEIWARLKDGTPLVTAAKRGNGRLVLFHVTANSDWSNLPMSGLFVDMLRRLSTMGTIGAAQSGTATETNANAGATETNDSNVLAPIRTLDGLGALRTPPPTAEPLKASELEKTVPSIEHPPGYYGQPASPRALNVLTPKSTLVPFPSLPASVTRLSYDNGASTALKPTLLGIALGLLFADILAVLVLQAGGIGGLFSRRSRPRAGTAAMIALGALSFAAWPDHVRAQDFSPQDFRQPDIQQLDSFAPRPQTDTTQVVRPGNLSAADKAVIEATGKVTLGYVVSGDRTTDETSRAGLEGLGRVLQTRTAVEPGEPKPVDIRKDEIAFYPILYWPVLDTAEALPDPVIAKIDAYMKEGGLIIFDTRDYGQGGSSTLPLAGKGGSALQRLLSKLDVPPLEPVPENHVVTKSFYLLRSFPGRWDGGQLWVEAIPNNDGDTHKARVSDGVTSIMITSNDLAAAWALDDRGRPIYPTVPGGEMQREMAFRGGINIVMHALTGNYKADQVHVPALLERLGQ